MLGFRSNGIMTGGPSCLRTAATQRRIGLSKKPSKEGASALGRTGGILSGMLAVALSCLSGCGQSAPVHDKAATQRMEDVKTDIKAQLDMGMEQHKQSQFKDMPPGMTVPPGGMPGGPFPSGPPGATPPAAAPAPVGPPRAP